MLTALLLVVVIAGWLGVLVGTVALLLIGT